MRLSLIFFIIILISILSVITKSVIQKRDYKRQINGEIPMRQWKDIDGEKSKRENSDLKSKEMTGADILCDKSKIDSKLENIGNVLGPH